MSSSSKSHSIPNSPDSARTSEDVGDKAEEVKTPLFETFGLSGKWQPAYDWATANNVLAELLLLIDATLIRNRPNRLGTVLREITRPTARDYLEQWQATDRSAALLNRLSQATLANKDILSTYRPLPTGRSARTQLGDETKPHYLFAVILEQLPPGSPKERDWFIALRLWLLVHGIRLARAGNLQDRYLQIVASAIRQACDRHVVWRSFISSLATPARIMDEFNAFLRFSADRVGGLKNTRPSHQNFCRALIAISRHDHNPEETGITGKRSNLLSALYPLRESSIEIASPPSAFSTGLDEDPECNVWPSGEDDADEGFFEQTVDSRKSYFHQTLKANSVLLLSGEEMQFLPWSYSRPNPRERTELDSWINRLLASGQNSEKLLGAFTWIARHTGQSLRRALDLALSTELGEGWRLDPDSMTLRRSPPMRRAGWQPKNEAERHWVAPLAAMNRLCLPKPAASVLRTRKKEEIDAKVLGDLWRDAETPESAFRRLRPGSLARVTPGIIGNDLPAIFHAATGDAALARLASSHPKTGMPAACAYANWSNTTVEGLLANGQDPALISATGSGSPPIGGGSRLDPIETLLVSALQSAAQRVEAAAAADGLVVFHNAYVAYVVVVLIAATGARPVRDPFEALAHFDFSQHFCFLNDKTSSDARENRLTPLPRKVGEWIRNDYCHYLSLLAQALERTHPALSADIASLTNRGARPHIPFLFMLSTEAELAWTSVSEKAIESTGLFDWPLPLRLFRHRLAQRLRRRGVDPEIIDALLGHADNAVATHGDESTRVWLDDMKAVRSALEAVFSDLGIRLVKCQPRLVPPAGRPPLESRDESPFGIAARERDRQQRSEHAREHAKRLIDDSLAGRKLSDLAEEEVDQLVKKLLFTENDLPRTLAHVYYDVFTDALNKVWREEGKKVRIKRRYAWAKPAPTPFTEQAPGALSLHHELTAQLDEILAGVQASRLSLRDCAALAIAQLCIDQRICDRNLLRDVANGKHFRLVTLQDRWWIEYAESIADFPDDPDLAVRAYPVSPRTASILDRLLDKQKDIDSWEKPVPAILAPITDKLQASGRWLGAAGDCVTLAERLCSVVDQFNCMTWPGVAAACMAGRIVSHALGWRDRIRLEFSAPARFAESDVSDAPYGSGVEQPGEGWTANGLRACRESEPDALQVLARKFFVGLRQVVTGQVDSIEHLLPPAPGSATKRRKAVTHPEPAPDTSNNPDEKRRRDLANLGKRYLRAWNGHVSMTVLLLGEWTVSLLESRRRGSKLLALSTIVRYLDALSPAFEDAGYDADLMLMEDEEVTDFYSQVLEDRKLERSDYVEGRLMEFHRWAARQGVEDPDWSELPETVTGVGVSPGVLTEAEYQAALRLLVHEKTSDPHLSLTHAFLLLGCYRFGLRGKECLGLQREDWIEDDHGNIVVLVRDNKVRQLKTPAGRRQVPLLFELSELEREVIKRWMLVMASMHGDASSVHMFSPLPDARLTLRKQRFTRHVGDVIKLVTSNPCLSLHHVRHTAACRIAVELLHFKSPAWVRASERDGKTSNRSAMTEILLGRNGPTRRTGWAMARYLGHAGRGTLFKNYLHVVDDWLRELQRGVLEKAAVGRIARAHVLDKVPRGKFLDTQLLDAAPAAQPCITPVQALQFMRLLAMGKDAADAAAALHMPLEDAGALHTALIQIGDRMRLSPLDRKVEKEKEKRGSGKESDKPSAAAEKDKDPLEFLRRIGRDGWNRMIRHVADKQEYPLVGHDGLAPLTSVKDAARMIGATRQLVMWEPAHFFLVRAAADFLEIGDERFVVVHSANWSDRQKEAARQSGFEVKDALAAGGERPMQLDTALDGENENRVEKRCVVLFEQNDDFFIRDRLEMIVAFMAVVAAVFSQPPPPATA